MLEEFHCKCCDRWIECGDWNYHSDTCMDCYQNDEEE